MNEGLQVLYKCFEWCFKMLFDVFVFDGVSVGWVLVSCFIMGLLIKNVIAIPQSNRISQNVERRFKDGNNES